MMHLAYVCQQFPKMSTVFEQNEILGILATGAEVSLLSCRRPAGQERSALHAFAIPLVERTHYFSIRRALRGLVWCLHHHPVQTLVVVATALGQCLCQPSRSVHHLGALLLAICFAPEGARKGWQWIHASFIQGTATLAWYLAQILGLPFSVTAHAFDIYSNRRGARDRDFIMARKLRAASYIFTVHEYGLRLLMNAFGHILSGKSAVRRCCIRIKDLPALAYPRETGTPLVVALGRLEPKKGFDTLIDAVGVLRARGTRLQCHIYGSGPEERRLYSRIAQAGLEDWVLLKGAYQQEALPQIMASASMLAMPSVQDRSGDMDGIPVVIYEAMAMARPVVASAISGIPEAVQHGETGLLLAPGDPEALADAVGAILADPSRAERMGAAGRAYVEKHHDHIASGAELMAMVKEACGAIASDQ